MVHTCHISGNLKWASLQTLLDPILGSRDDLGTYLWPGQNKVCALHHHSLYCGFWLENSYCLNFLSYDTSPFLVLIENRSFLVLFHYIFTM